MQSTETYATIWIFSRYENMKNITPFLLAIIFIFAFATSAQAFEFRSGDNISFPQDASTSGSLAIAGRNVTVDGNVDGDLFCAGQNITINADIDGDVLCAGQTITINGRVNGDVRTAAQSVIFSTGQVVRNVTAFAQDVFMRGRSAVRGEVGVGAQHFELSESVIGKDLTGGAETANINGGVGGDVRLEVDQLTLGPEATIAGSLQYGSDNDAVISENATVSGSITKSTPIKQEKKETATRAERTRDSFSLAGLLSKLVFYGLLAFVLMSLFPKYTARISEVLKHDVGKSVGFGFLSLFVIPILLLLLTITIIGIPVAILGFFVWMTLMFTARIFIIPLVGDWTLDQLKYKDKTPLLSVVVGTVVTVLLFKIPVLGGLFAFLAMLWSFGAMLLTLPQFAHFRNSTSKRTIN